MVLDERKLQKRNGQNRGRQILISKKIWFRNRGLYFGDSQGAGADFIVKIEGKEVSIGLRSIAPDSLYKWKSVAYPDDRIREEPEKIAQFHIVCNHADGHTKFFGIISKEEMMKELEQSKRLYSPKNGEYFRIIPLDKFNFSNLVGLIDKMDVV